MTAAKKSAEAEIAEATALAERLVESLPEVGPTVASFALGRALAAVMVSGLGRLPNATDYDRMTKALRLHCEIVHQAIAAKESH